MFRTLLRTATRHMTVRSYASMARPSIGRRAVNYFKSSHFAMIFLVGCCASELVYIINTKSDFEKLEIKSKAKIDILTDLIERAKRGEEFDIDKELAGFNRSKDKSLDDILAELESFEQAMTGSEQNESDESQKEYSKQVVAEAEPTHKAEHSELPEGQRKTAKFM